MARMLITGGAGFLGSHLADSLISRGDGVVAVDDLSTGRLRNVEHLASHDRFQLIEHDACLGLPVDGSFDAVLHFASPASPPQYRARPLATLEAGSTATRHALELARRCDARFLLASTSEVYGDPLMHPQSERYHGNVNPIGPRSMYDEAKRFAEALTTAYRREGLVDTAIVRIFNTYGPRLEPADGRVVSNFCIQALTGRSLTVYGDGSQTRSYCYVADEVRGILALLDSSLSGPVNIGNPNEHSVAELAKVVLSVTGSSSDLGYEPLPADDPVRRCPDISVAREELGWEPEVSLEEGLERTVAWYREELGRGPA